MRYQLKALQLSIALHSEPEDLRLERLPSLNENNRKASNVEVLKHSEDSPGSKNELVQDLAAGDSKSSVDAFEGLTKHADGLYPGTKSGSGIYTKNVSELFRNRNLKTNFLYIKDMINKN